MAPTTVHMVLVEGENADGVTVDEDDIELSPDGDSATFTGPDQVVSAILGTREGATEAGYALLSTGVTCSDQVEASALRDALAAHKMENVMLVSAFLAAAALAQTVGNATGHEQTALLFIEPDTATLGVVNSADGSVADVHREILPEDDDEAVAKLVEMVSGAEALETRPDAVFVVGSGIDIPLIKPALAAATSLPPQRSRGAGDGAGPRCGTGLGECPAVRVVDGCVGLRAGSRHRRGQPVRSRSRQSRRAGYADRPRAG
jgi:hypothetical protein